VRLRLELGFTLAKQMLYWLGHTFKKNFLCGGLVREEILLYEIFCILSNVPLFYNFGLSVIFHHSEEAIHLY
jgi:hypothetical protein